MVDPYSRFRDVGIRSIGDVVEFADIVCRRFEPVCRKSSEIYYRGELEAGFIIESPDERDGISLHLGRCDFIVGTPLYKAVCLSIAFTHVRSNPPPGLLAISPILVIPIGDVIEDILVEKEGHVYGQVKPIDTCWGMTVYGKRAEIAIESFYIDPEIEDKFYNIRITIQDKEVI